MCVFRVSERTCVMSCFKWTLCVSDVDSLFDVIMGSFDGAETGELVGSYLLSQLSAECGNDIGLYSDDGLAAFD